MLYYCSTLGVLLRGFSRYSRWTVAWWETYCLHTALRNSHWRAEEAPWPGFESTASPPLLHTQTSPAAGKTSPTEYALERKTKKGGEHSQAHLCRSAYCTLSFLPRYKMEVCSYLIIIKNPHLHTDDCSLQGIMGIVPARLVFRHAVHHVLE